MKTMINVSDKLYDYILSTSLREHPVLKALREKTAALPGGGMQISPDQGQFFALLIKIMSAKKIVEVGTFTGYSALVMAQSLADDGRLITCDIDKHSTNIAQEFWKKAGVDHKIDLRLVPAKETLTAMLDNNEKNTVDFAFIDADKRGYDDYYEQCLQLLKPGGLIAIDNVLWSGEVINPENDQATTRAIRAFNKKINADSRVDVSLIPIGDGVMLARKIA